MKNALTSTLKPGILNTPGAASASRSLVQRLLTEDYLEHHCFYNKIPFHNHLSHHILAAYDLGAPPGLLQAIHERENRTQRPADLGQPPEEIPTISETNWIEKLGDPKAYSAYLDFFSGEVASRGISGAGEKYIFSPEANGNEALMLTRFVSGALHPIIQFGHGAEFDEQLLAASGLAQTAVHSPRATEAFSPNWPFDVSYTSFEPSLPNSYARGRQPSQGVSLLEVLRRVYDSPKLVPVLPYDPNAHANARIKSALEDGRAEELARISSLWSIPEVGTDKEWKDRAEECIWLATLLMAGVSKPNRPPRLDFFLMHALTSSLFLPSILRILDNPSSKKFLLITWVRAVLVYVIARGRPRIDPELLMSYAESPHPPTSSTVTVKKSDSVGTVSNPWPAIIVSATHAPDSHVTKTIRSLSFGAIKYGTIPPGGAIGAFSSEDGKETHVGTAKMDGTIFVRAAGIVLDTLGWVDHGQKEGSWDESALGWDEAWD